MSLRQADSSTSTHEDTATTRAVARIEARLKRTLNQIYSAIKKDVGLVSTAGSVGVSFGDIRSFYELQTHDTIRASVAEIYTEGAKYVVSRIANLTFYLTETDMIAISNMAAEYIEYFWTGLQNEFVKKLATAFDPKDLLQVKQIQLKDSFIDRLVESMSTRITSEATLLKARQLADRPVETPRFRAAQTEEEDEDLLLLTLVPGSGLIAASFLFLLSEGRQEVKFVTAKDERTCPICRPLDGKTFNINDPNMPVPVLDTHYRCRCRIMLTDSKGRTIMK